MGLCWGRVPPGNRLSLDGGTPKRIIVTMGSLLRWACVVGVVAVAIGGCAAPVDPPRPPVIAVIVPNLDLNFSQEVSTGFQAAATGVGGVQVEVVGPDIVDGPRQVQMLRDLLGRSVDGITLFTLAPDLFRDPLAQAQAQGIPMIAVDNPLPVGSGAPLFIGNDNVELGKLLADQVIAQLPADAGGTVVIGNSAPGTLVLDRRVDGMRQQFGARRPGIRVLGPFDTKQEVSANLTAWRTLVAANPGALAFLGTGDADGWNLAAIKTATRAPWRAGAFDLDPRALAAVKNGDLVLVSPEHYLMGALAGRLQARTATSGAELPHGWLYVPGLAVTQQNVEQIQARQASATARSAAVAGQLDAILDHPSEYLRPLDEVS